MNLNNHLTFLLFNLFITTIFFSCNEQNKNLDNEMNNFKRMDTMSNDNSLYQQKVQNNSLSYEDINIGNRILLGSISKEIIKRRKITNIKVVDFIDEKYDSLSNMIYEKCTSWTEATTYKYFYNKNGKPNYVISNSDTIKYKYDDQNRLINCGNLIVKYFPNGFKKSVENSVEIERYEYDFYGNICHVSFDIKPNVTIECGNRTRQWFGKYDNSHKLIQTKKDGFPIETYKYSNDGKLIQKLSFDNYIEDSIITDYIYQDKTLTIKTKHKK